MNETCTAPERSPAPDEWQRAGAGPTGADDMDFVRTSVWPACERRVRRWRVPPRWSPPEWYEELQAEAMAAAVEAMRTFRPERNVPLGAYLRLRVLGRALARLRKEWGYARRLSARPDEADAMAVPERGDAALLVDLAEALAGLPDAERRLLRDIFWHGRAESELAGELGVSQQAVSKRKIAVISRLSKHIK